MEIEESKEIRRLVSNIKLEDVVGQERAKTKCKIIMKYLQDPSHFGEWAPRMYCSTVHLELVRLC